jgi:hypothetical protein
MPMRPGTKFRVIAAAFCVAALSTGAATPPSQMMANVYRLTQASAVLDICFASAAFKSLPGDEAAKLRDLSRRIGDLIGAIGMRYGDHTLADTYDATRARIAADTNLQLHVKNHYEYCGERLATSMSAYVVENEALLNGFFRKEALMAPKQ